MLQLKVVDAEIKELKMEKMKKGGLEVALLMSWMKATTLWSTWVSTRVTANTSMLGLK